MYSPANLLKTQRSPRKERNTQLRWPESRESIRRVPELNPFFANGVSGHQNLRMAGLRRFARIARTVMGPKWVSSNFLHINLYCRRVPPCAVKTCAVRPGFARVVAELWAADPNNVQVPVKPNASPGQQSEAPRPRWKPGPEQNPGPENQDSQHMLEQPRGYFPDTVSGKSAEFCRTVCGNLEELFRQISATTPSRATPYDLSKLLRNLLEEEIKAPTPTLSALVRTQPVY